MDIELQWWAGCPSTEQARTELHEVLSELGLAEVNVRMREIGGDAEARALRFPGSPTILIDGCDVVEPGPGDPVGLTCRVYRRRDGRLAATPDPADIRHAVQEASR
jgi:hypothetical protein